MNIEVVGRDVEIAIDARDRLEKKLEKLLGRRNREIPVRVLVSQGKAAIVTQITMSMFGKDVVAQAENANIIASFDEAIDKVERQVNKIYDKQNERR